MPSTPSSAGCRNCALLLARRCYAKHWWFRLVREPLVLGMRLLARCNGIDARRHPVSNPECHGCIRFMKAELQERSTAFRLLNDRIGPWFTKVRDSMLSQAELAEARRRAATLRSPPGALAARPACPGAGGPRPRRRPTG